MAIPTCPKCGRHMSWYMYYKCGVPISGWKCTYDKFDMLTDYKAIVTDHTENARRKNDDHGIDVSDSCRSNGR